MFTRINIFMGPRHHHRPHFGMGGWFAPPMMYNSFDRMFKYMKPLMIGSMISSIGAGIAGIISGKGTNNVSTNCNCNNVQYNPYNMLYGNNYNMANTLMYPYVNLNNTTNQTNQTQETEGKGSSRSSNNNSTIAKMEKAYKKYGIESIYQLDDGRYCAVTKNGNITGLTLADLADEISDYYGKPVDEIGEAGEAGAVADGNEAGDASEAGQAGRAEQAVTQGKPHNQFVKSEWHRYLSNPKSRADEFKNISLELGKTDSSDTHRKNPAEYALNSLINQLGLAGVKYDSDSYKNLLNDFIRMNPSLFKDDGTMKAGYQNKIDKLDLPSKATLIREYHLKEAETKTPESQTKLGGKYTTSLPNGKYGYQYANGNMMYSSKSYDSLDSDAVFKIGSHEYKLNCNTTNFFNNTIDYWNLLGERTTSQLAELNIIDSKSGKFKTDKEYINENGTPRFTFIGDKNSQLNGAQLIKYNNKVYVQLQDGKTKFPIDEVMAGLYNDKLR